MRIHFSKLLPLLALVLSACGGQNWYLDDGPPPARFGLGKVPYSQLVRALDTTAAAVQFEAIRQLALRFPDSAWVPLIGRYRDLDAVSRWLAAEAITTREPGLIAFLDSVPTYPDSVLPEGPWPVSKGLARSGRSIDSVARRFLGHDRPAVRGFGLSLLSNAVDSGVGYQAILELVEPATRDPDPSVRESAYDVYADVAELDPMDSAHARSTLVRGLADTAATVRWQVLFRLMVARVRAPDLIGEILAVAERDPDGRNRTAAIEVLGYQGEAAASVLPAIRALTADTSEFVSTEAARTLGRLAQAGIGRRDSLSISAVRRVALEGDSYQRSSAVFVLGTLGDTAGVRGYLSDPDTSVAERAIFALAILSPYDHSLGSVLDDPRLVVRARGIDASAVALTAGRTLDPLPRTAVGLAALDSARVIARWMDTAGVIGRCFRVDRSAFKPEADMGLDSVFMVPPRMLRFLGRPNLFPSGWMVVATNGAGPGPYPVGGWGWDERSRRLNVTWTDGLSGRSMSLHRDGDGWRGKLRPFWDFPRRPQVAKVTLTPVPCDGPEVIPIEPW